MKKENPSDEALLFPTDTRTIPLHQEIATQAHTLWDHYGRPTGRDVDIWLEAERQALGIDKRINQQAGGAVETKSLGLALAADAPLPGTDNPAGRRSHR